MVSADPHMIRISDRDEIGPVPGAGKIQRLRYKLAHTRRHHAKKNAGEKKMFHDLCFCGLEKCSGSYDVNTWLTGYAAVAGDSWQSEEGGETVTRQRQFSRLYLKYTKKDARMQVLYW
jgi:hypothetical protein